MQWQMFVLWGLVAHTAHPFSSLSVHSQTTKWVSRDVNFNPATTHSEQKYRKKSVLTNIIQHQHPNRDKPAHTIHVIRRTSDTTRIQKRRPNCDSDEAVEQTYTYHPDPIS